MEPEFADQLNRLLQDADRPASWLARRLHLSASTVSRWLDGTTQPESLMRVEAILDTLRIDEQEVRLNVLNAYRYWWRRRTILK